MTDENESFNAKYENGRSRSLRDSQTRCGDHSLHSEDCLVIQRKPEPKTHLRIYLHVCSRPSHRNPVPSRGGEFAGFDGGAESVIDRAGQRAKAATSGIPRGAGAVGRAGGHRTITARIAGTFPAAPKDTMNSNTLDSATLNSAALVQALTFDISRTTEAATLHRFRQEILAQPDFDATDRAELCAAIDRRFAFLNAQSVQVNPTLLKPR